MRHVRWALWVFLACISRTCLATDVAFVFEVYPPYEYVERGQLAGMDVDLIREACRRLSLNPVFRERPWSRALVEVKSGKADAIFSLVKTPERERFLFFPEENLSFEQFIFLARRDSTLTLAAASDLKGKRVGVCSGYSYDPRFDEDSSFEREASLNDEQQLRKLAGGRMDVAIMNRQVFHYTAHKLGMTDLFQVMPYELPIRHEMYVAFSVAHGDSGRSLADQFSRILKEMKKDGTYLKITKSAR